jgi:hypothetical protein
LADIVNVKAAVWCTPSLLQTESVVPLHVPANVTGVGFGLGFITTFGLGAAVGEGFSCSSITGAGDCCIPLRKITAIQPTPLLAS